MLHVDPEIGQWLIGAVGGGRFRERLQAQLASLGDLPLQDQLLHVCKGIAMYTHRSGRRDEAVDVHERGVDIGEMVK